MATRRWASTFGNIAVAWIVLMAIWLAASATLEAASVATGCFIAAVLAVITIRNLPFWHGLTLGFGRPIAGVVFLAVFLKDMVISNVAVLGYVYAPHRTILPTVTSIQVRITGPRERLALTNALALTPGTLAISLEGDMLRMHVLDEAFAAGAVQSVRTYETLLERAFG